jgi:hypothetical protein
VIKSKDEMPIRKAEIDLTGPDGNAFVLLGIARKSAKMLGLNAEEIAADMMSSDYEHLIEVFDHHFGENITLYR